MRVCVWGGGGGGGMQANAMVNKISLNFGKIRMIILKFLLVQK